MVIKPRYIAALLLFIPTCIFFRTGVDPALLYHAQEPPFLLGPSFFSNFAAYPGGPAWYASAFLTQWYQIPWAGAFIITAIIFLVYGQTVVFNRTIDSRGQSTATALGELGCALPALLLMAAYCNYLLPLTYAVELLVALVSVNLYRAWSSAKAPIGAVIRPSMATTVRYLLFFILLAAVYYLAGSGALLFAALCVLDELLSQKKISGAIVMTAVTALLPLVAAKYVFALNIPSAYYDLLGLKTHLLEAAPYPRIPRLIYGAGAIFPLLLTVRSLVVAPGRGRRPPKTNGFMNGPAAFWIPMAIIAIAGAVLAHYSFDKKTRENYRIDYYACRGQWDEITRAVTPATMGNYSILSQAHLFRALYYRGRLLSDLFSYPQAIEGRAFLAITGQMAKYYPLPMSDFYYEAGALNQAEFWASEALSLSGPKPRVLQRLALINILKGRKNSALKFAALLDETVLNREAARQCRGLIENDSLVAADPELRQLRRCMPDSEYICRDYYAELVQLFLSHSENRTAFEYLVAENLLNNSISPVMDNLGFFAKFGYTSLPRHVEEAMVFQAVMSKSTATSMSGYEISREYCNRFEAFNRIFDQFRNYPAQALNAAAADFGTTYWFYLASSNKPVFLKKNE